MNKSLLKAGPFKLGLLIGISILLSNCAQKSSSDSNSIKPNNEEVACGSKSISNGVTLTGLANFEAAIPTSTGLSGFTTKPIRYAEVRVKDAKGTIIQCGETGSAGEISLTVPKSTSLKIEVNSRSYGAHVKASILDNTTSNKFYTLSRTQTSSNVDFSIGTLTATYDGNTFGGAFNILDQVLEVNEFLRNNTNSSITTTFTVAPKVEIFWAPGFTPGAYFDEPSEGISFFYPGKELNGGPGLFILGGVGGNTSTADTDHFDNCVIIHEYTHYLDYIYSQSDSPGGSHDGNTITDPRLAWAEGLAYYMYGAVTGNHECIDTRGSEAGQATIALNINLETPQINQDRIITRNPAGEGNFRELSVARSLFDLTDSDNDTGQNGGADTLNLDFAYVWEALTSSSVGLRKSTLHFITIGHFFQLLYDLIPSSDQTAFDNVLEIESQRRDTQDWGTIVSASTSSCGTTEILPTIKQYKSGNWSVDNFFLSVDFYQFYHQGGSLDISLEYTRKTGSPQTNLDLQLYPEGFTYNETESLAGFSEKRISQEPVSGAKERIQLSSLAPGYYLIAVRAVESDLYQKSAGADYRLKIGSIYLCP